MEKLINFSEERIQADFSDPSVARDTNALFESCFENSLGSCFDLAAAFARKKERIASKHYREKLQESGKSKKIPEPEKKDDQLSDPKGSCSMEEISSQKENQVEGFKQRSKSSKKSGVLTFRQVEERVDNPLRSIYTPFISAKHYIVTLIDPIHRVLCSSRASKRRPIASLTKMMTLHLSLKLCERFDIEPETTQVLVSRRATLIPGTKANLEPFDKLSLKDLFYSLMLPSGNDAANALNEFFNSHLSETSFVDSMNEEARSIGMFTTFFANPHGLDHPEAFSSACDMAKLLAVASRRSRFLEIVSTQQKELTLQRFKRSKSVVLQNTNHLLGKDECIGGKTGTTPNAGFCLATLWEFNGLRLVIVVMQCESNEARFGDTFALFQAARGFLSSR